MSAAPPTFYYDLNSPYAWLAAERVNQTLPELPQWQPVSFGHILKHHDRKPWSLGPGREPGMKEIEQRAKERNLQEIRWPEGWPLQTYGLTQLRAAVYANEIGKGVAFALAAFRQMFNAGHSLNDIDTVLLAGAACEIQPKALLKSIERDSIKQKLKDTTDEAIGLGIHGVPTVRVGDELFWGDDRLEDAAAALARAA